MDLNRLKQIISTPTDIDVLYNGVSVWVDQLNEDGRTATVHLRDGEEKTIVEIGELEEKS